VAKGIGLIIDPIRQRNAKQPIAFKKPFISLPCNVYSFWILNVKKRKDKNYKMQV
jgi:hypothetical protein